MLLFLCLVGCSYYRDSKFHGVFGALTIKSYFNLTSGLKNAAEYDRKSKAGAGAGFGGG